MRVLPADVYDTLELSAWEFGGIGACNCFDSSGAPLCAMGHVIWCESEVGPMHYGLDEALGHITVRNDEAVRAINASSGNAANARVPFSRWCKELDVVRGD